MQVPSNATGITFRDNSALTIIQKVLVEIGIWSQKHEFISGLDVPALVENVLIMHTAIWSFNIFI